MWGRGIMLVVGLLAAMLPAVAPAQEPPGPKNVEFVRHIPFDVQSAIASEHLGQYLYLTGTRALSIYDVADPLDPQLVSHVPLGYQWQNEDVSTNGKVLLISESLPGDVLHVWDVSNPQLPLETGRLLLAGNHTMECLHDCTWAYGSEGDIADIRDPANPVLAGNWMDIVGFSGGVHDVNEVRPGLAVVATYDQDFLLLDVEDPLHPRIVGTGPHPEPDAYILHQVVWPRLGADSIAVASGETGDGPILSYRVTRSPGAPPVFEPVGRYTLGSSSHWFDVHPRFRDGGLLAVGWYSDGTRILQVGPDGQIDEVGHYHAMEQDPADPLNLVNALPPPSTWAARWISDDIVYAIDNGRGIDVLRWIGPIPQPPAPPSTPGSSPSPGAEQPPAVTGCLGADRAARRTRGGVLFPGARSVGLWRRGKLARTVFGNRVKARQVPRGVVEARARVGDGVRRVALVRRGRRVRIGAPLEGSCGPLRGFLSAPAYGRRAPLRLHYTLARRADVQVTVGGRVLRAPGEAGTHVLPIPARGRGVSVRLSVPGAGAFTLGARRG